MKKHRIGGNQNMLTVVEFGSKFTYEGHQYLSYTKKVYSKTVTMGRGERKHLLKHPKTDLTASIDGKVLHKLISNPDYPKGMLYGEMNVPAALFAAARGGFSGKTFKWDHASAPVRLPDAPKKEITYEDIKKAYGVLKREPSELSKEDIFRRMSSVLGYEAIIRENRIISPYPSPSDFMGARLHNLPAHTISEKVYYENLFTMEGVTKDSVDKACEIALRKLKLGIYENVHYCKRRLNALSERARLTDFIIVDPFSC